MRGFLQSSRKLSAGWYWPLILLALPACALQTGGLENPNAFNGGDQPLSSAVMCDIPKVQDNGRSSRCATSVDLGIGILDTTAAVSLADGTHNNTVIDQSIDAINECGPLGKVTEFFDPFPNGTTVCLNCMQVIPTKFAGPDAVCVAKCKELVSQQEGSPTGGLDAYCQTNAHASTNFKPNVCFTNACSSGGNPIMPFADQRINAEPVEWSTGIGEDVGVMVNGNTVTQTAATPPDTGTFADFQAGAAATQIITRGDAWVEFEANDNTVSQVLGVHASPCAKAADCPDADPSLNDIGFGIILNKDGHFYTIESSPAVANSQSFGTYLAHDRFRVHITDNHDGTARISYGKLTAACTAGMPCSETIFGQQIAANPKYPLRIDASFREQGATLANVTVMRIKDDQ